MKSPELVKAITHQAVPAAQGRGAAPAVSQSDDLPRGWWANKTLVTSPQRLVETGLPFPEWAQGAMDGKFTL